MTSVVDPDPHASPLISVGWIRIRTVIRIQGSKIVKMLIRYCFEELDVLFRGLEALPSLVIKSLDPVTHYLKCWVLDPH